MKNFCFIFLLVLSISSCFKKQECNKSPEFVSIGLEDNPYEDIDKISFISIVNGKRQTYYKLDTFNVSKDETYCNTDCVYGGACAKYYNYTTSYLRFKSIDSKIFTVANTYYSKGQDGSFDRYVYTIDSNEITIPSQKESGYTWNKEKIDTLKVNNKEYRFVLKNTIHYWEIGCGCLRPKGEIYFTSNNLILRMVDFFAKDTLDLE
jgi:hypothetical protein